MNETPRVALPYPSDGQDPWYDAFESMILEIDAALYAQREDRSAVLMGGGTVTWDATTGVLSWSDPLEILSPIVGVRLVVEAGTLTLLDGQCIELALVRAPSDTTLVTVVARSGVTNTNDTRLLAIRRGTVVYWVNGRTILDGQSVPLMTASGGVDETTLVHKAGAETITGVKTFTQSPQVPSPSGASDAVPKSYVDSLAPSGVVLANGTVPLTNNWSVGGYRLTSLGAPTSAQDAATKSYVDAVSSQLGDYVLRNGSAALTADWSVGGFQVTGLPAPFSATDAARKSYVDAADTAVLAAVNASVLFRNGTTPLTANWDVGGFKLTNLADPTNPQDAATRAWVLANASGLPSGGANGGILGYAGGAGAWVAPGTAGQVLVSGGTGIAAFGVTTLPLTQRVIDGSTAAVSTAATLTHQLSAGGATSGIGTRLLFQTERTGSVVVDNAYIDAVLTTAASPVTSELRFSVTASGTAVRPFAIRDSGALISNGFGLLYDAGVALDVFAMVGGTVMTFGTTNGTYSGGTVLQGPSNANLQLVRGSTVYVNIQGGGGLILGTVGDFVRLNATYIQVNGPVHVRDTSTSAPSVALTLGHALTSGTAVAGIGTRLVYTAVNASGVQVDLAYEDALLTNAAGGSEASAWVVYTRTGGAAPVERARIHGTGGLTVGTAQALTSGIGISNAVALWARNAADNAWVQLANVDAANRPSFGTSAVGTLIDGASVELRCSSVSSIQFTTAGGARFTYVGFVFGASGVEKVARIHPAISQSGTAGYTALEIDLGTPTTGSGTKRGVSVVRAGTERFGVTDSGRLVNGDASNEATSATAGANGALPAQVAGYLIFQDSGGTARKVPYYN